MSGLAETTRTSVVQKADTGGQLPGQIMHETRTPVSADPHEPTGTNNEQTDAGASERSPRENPPNAIPFKVYAAIATQALEKSLREDKTDAPSNVNELFKQACAQHRPDPLPYDGELVRKAVDAAIHARARAANTFTEQFRQIAARGMR